MAINPYYSLPSYPTTGGWQSTPSGGSGGGGWYGDFAGGGGGDGNMGNSMLGGAGTGAAIGSVIPGIGTLAGAGIGAAISLLGGLFGGMAKGAKQKKTRKAYEQAQAAYQAKANQLFPELPKESFMFKSPGLNNAIQGALASRMMNMFGDWGMPQGRTGGMDQLNQLFAALMPQQQPPMQIPPGNGPYPMPGPGMNPNMEGPGMGRGMGPGMGRGMRPGMGGPGMSPGGWYGDFSQFG